MRAKIHRRFLLALATLALALGAQAPSAAAEFAFEPGSVYAKGHAPLTQAFGGVVPAGYTLGVLFGSG